MEGVVGVVAMINDMELFAFWNSEKWDELLSTFFNNSRNLIVIVYVYDQESFGCLMTSVHKSRFVAKLMFEFGAYHLGKDELPLKWSIIMGIPILLYVYLFSSLASTNGVNKTFKNKRPPNILDFMLTNQNKKRKVYQVQRSPKA
jgi:hypothetical protein